MKQYKIEDACVIGPDAEVYIKASEHGTDKTFFFKRDEHAEKVIFKGDQTVWEVVNIQGDRIVAKNKLGSLVEAHKNNFTPYSGLESSHE